MKRMHCVPYSRITAIAPFDILQCPKDRSGRQPALQSFSCDERMVYKYVVTKFLSVLPDEKRTRGALQAIQIRAGTSAPCHTWEALAN